MLLNAIQHYFNVTFNNKRNINRNIKNLYSYALELEESRIFKSKHGIFKCIIFLYNKNICT